MARVLAASPLDAALQLRAIGLSVIPVHARGIPWPAGADEKEAGKRPLVRWREFQTRRAEPAEVERWWRRWQTANVGIVTGAISGLVVLDVDVIGLPTLAEWEAAELLPPTWRAATGGGGVHLYFRLPLGEPLPSSVALWPGIDVKADGGVVVVPPSLHRSGQRYTWDVSPFDAELAVLPKWLLVTIKHLHARSNGRGGGFRLPERIAQGERNTALYALARSLALRGFNRAGIVAALSAANEGCDEPLPDGELEALVDKAVRQPHRPDFAAAHGTGGRGSPAVKEPRARLVRLADVEPEAVVWLWPGRIPRGKLTLIIGDPGVGKSYLTVDLVSRVTTGRAWPDGSAIALGNALILSAEDGLADTIRPRVDRFGGDPGRVWVIQAVQDGSKDRLFNFQTDLGALERAITETGASLVVVDPLSAYLGKVDSFKDAEVRSLLAPVAALAERTGVAVVGVLHLTKDAQRQAIHRALGSIAFAAAPRAIFAVAKDHDVAHRRLFVPVKLNLAPLPPAMAFTLTAEGLVWEDAPVAVDADAVLSPGSPEERAERHDARVFLVELLRADGVLSAKNVLKAADQVGISRAALYRAKHALRVKSERSGGLGGSGEWFWSLPEDTKDAHAPAKDAHPAETEHLRPSADGKSRNDDHLPKDAHASQGEHLSEHPWGSLPERWGQTSRAKRLASAQHAPGAVAMDSLRARVRIPQGATGSLSSPPNSVLPIVKDPLVCELCGASVPRSEFAPHVTACEGPGSSGR